MQDFAISGSPAKGCLSTWVESATLHYLRPSFSIKCSIEYWLIYVSPDSIDARILPTFFTKPSGGRWSVPDDEAPAIRINTHGLSVVSMTAKSKHLRMFFRGSGG